MTATPKRQPVGFVFQMQLKQLQLHMKTGAWAAYLGIDRSTWYLLRMGEKELTLAIMQRVLSEWPAEFEPFLKEAVLGYRLPRGESSRTEALPRAC